MQSHRPILILAIDTTSEHGSLALAQGQDVLECHEVHARQAFSKVVFQQIRALLERHGARLEDVGLFAAAAGPGSFTGVRVGLTAAKGLAAVEGKPVAPVSNLAATAALAPAGPRILIPLLDARRGEIFAGVYERTDPLSSSTSLRRLTEELVGQPQALEEWLAALKLLLPEDAAFCGPDVGRLCALFTSGRSAVASFARLETGRALAAAVARLAYAAYCAEQVTTPEAADANYVRRADAEILRFGSA